MKDDKTPVDGELDGALDETPDEAPDEAPVEPAVEDLAKASTPSPEEPAAEPASRSEDEWQKLLKRNKKLQKKVKKLTEKLEKMGPATREAVEPKPLSDSNVEKVNVSVAPKPALPVRKPLLVKAPPAQGRRRKLRRPKRRERAV